MVGSEAEIVRHSGHTLWGSPCACAAGGGSTGASPGRSCTNAIGGMRRGEGGGGGGLSCGGVSETAAVATGGNTSRRYCPSGCSTSTSSKDRSGGSGTLNWLSRQRGQG